MEIASEFGPATWNRENWIGVGIYAAAFFIAVVLIFRIAKPRADGDEGTADEGEASNGR